MKRKKKTTKPKDGMKTMTIRVDRAQIAVLNQIARNAGTTIDIVASVFVATAVYKQIASAREIEPMT